MADTIWYERDDRDELIEGALGLTLPGGPEYGPEAELVAGAHVDTDEALRAACTICGMRGRPARLWLVTGGDSSRLLYHISARGTWTAA